MNDSGGAVLGAPAHRAGLLRWRDAGRASSPTPSAKYIDLLRVARRTSPSTAWRATVTSAVNVIHREARPTTSDDLGDWLARQLCDGNATGRGVRPTRDARLVRLPSSTRPPGRPSSRRGRTRTGVIATSLCGPRAWDLPGWHWQTMPALGPAPAIAFALVGGVRVRRRLRRRPDDVHDDARARRGSDRSAVRDLARVRRRRRCARLLDGADRGRGDRRPVRAGCVAARRAGRRRLRRCSASGRTPPRAPATIPAFPPPARRTSTSKADVPDSFFEPNGRRTVRGVAIPAGRIADHRRPALQRRPHGSVEAHRRGSQRRRGRLSRSWSSRSTRQGRERRRPAPDDPAPSSRARAGRRSTRSTRSSTA